MAIRHRIEASPPWVLILDNADNLRLFGVSHTTQDAFHMGEDALFLHNFIPRGPRGQVLWTSRDERIAGGLVAARRAIKVSNMTQVEAKELFDSVRNSQVNSDETKDIEALLVELDWLPLAISQAAAYLRRTLTTVEEYMVKLKEGKKRWRLLKQSQTDRHRRPEVSNSILETWDISMKHLQIENKTSYQILHIHAFLDNQNISAELIKQAALYSPEGDVTDHVHEARDDDSSSDSDSDGDQITEAIARLCDFSFLSLQATGDGYRAYKMHKLVQEAMKYGLGRKDRKKEEENFSAAALEIVSGLFPVSRGRDVWNECEKYITHAQQACEWASLCGRQSGAADLLKRLSHYLYDRGRWRERETVDQRAYELRKTTLGDNHLETIASMSNLAVSYHELGRYKEAGEITLKTLELRREILGERHPDTIWSMSSLAETYRALGRYKEAEGIEVKVLAFQQEILRDSHPGTIWSMAKLAATYYRLGRYKEAEGIEVEVLVLRRDILGATHPDTIWSMASLATIYHRLGRYKEAEGIEVEVLALRREFLGDTHPDTIWSMAELAATYYRLGRYKEAEGIEVEVLALRREVLGATHPDTIKGMSYLAITYRALGKDEEAEKLEDEAEKLEDEAEKLKDKEAEKLA